MKYLTIEERIDSLERFLYGKESNMINVLHVVNGWPSGGITEQVYLLCKHLPKSKFNQYSIGYCHYDGEFFDKFIKEGVPCIKSDIEYSNLSQVIEENKIDIVHKQTGGGDCPPYVKMLKEMGIPLVESLHCPRATGIPNDLVEAIIYTTDYTKFKNDASTFRKMHSIQYALDLARPIEIHKNRQDKVIVGRLGRIVPDKRIDIILELSKIAYKEFGDRIEFHLAGMIPDDYPVHVEYGKGFLKAVDSLPNVSYFGFVDNKYDFWKTLDICVNPVWEASFDIVFLEAMACKVPILTWDNSAAKYVVGNAGIVTEENIHSLYEGLKKLINDSGRRDLLGEIGQEYIRTKYSLETFVEAYKKLYEGICQKYYA